MKPDYITDLDWHLLKNKFGNKIPEIIEKLKSHYPVQYLIGNVEFLNTIICVDERVLIPRFETELLVDKTIKKIKELNLTNPKILELGTGSGCISIALNKNISCEIEAIDISPEAINLAQKNALENRTEINFFVQDMLTTSFEHVDVLISNPPYVTLEESVGEETKYEPSNALYASDNGLYFYKQIIAKLSKIVDQPKLIAFEIGSLQGESLCTLTSNYLSNYHCIIEKDLTGRDRYAFLTLV